MTVLLPVWDEGDVVGEVVSEVMRLSSDRVQEIILVVSERSDPHTKEVVADLQERDSRVVVISQTGPPGVGNAVRQGLAASRGAWVVMIDSDGEMDPATVPLLLAEQERSGADLVVASRWVKGGGVVGYDAWKLPLNRVFQVLFRAVARASVHDLTLGFKLLRGDLARGLPWKAERHEIGIETTLRPIRAGARASEVPTIWRRRKAGRSKGTFLMNFRYVWMALQVMMSPTEV